MRQALCNSALSACLSPTACCWGGFAAVGPVGRRYWLTAAGCSRTAFSSKCKQCHIVSWHRKLNTDLLSVELIWVILQVEEGGVLAVTQLLSNINADVAQAASMPVDNPFLSLPAAALPPIADNTVTSYNLPPASGTIDVTPRHSSLPSSPRWLGESSTTSTSPMLIPNEPLRARAVLFQVCLSCNWNCESFWAGVANVDWSVWYMITWSVISQVLQLLC